MCKSGSLRVHNTSPCSKKSKMVIPASRNMMNECEEDKKGKYQEGLLEICPL
jgi:hypothetical protein